MKPVSIRKSHLNIHLLNTHYLITLKNLWNCKDLYDFPHFWTTQWIIVIIEWPNATQARASSKTSCLIHLLGAFEDAVWKGCKKYEKLQRCNWNVNPLHCKHER